MSIATHSGSLRLRDHPGPMFGPNRLKLGIFSANCAGGMAVTKAPERWNASWDNNVELARMADDADIEFLLPIARWLGYGGDTDFQAESLETIAWCCGLLASTRKISVFATIHTAFWHPIAAAKQLATVDHVGRGRLGLNIVAGWNKPEYDMFGLDLPDGHEIRYALSQEWFDIVMRLWTSEEPLDWDGRFFRLKNAQLTPKPVHGLPPIMNAGSSDEGREFAARNADYLFTVMIDPGASASDIADVRNRAKASGRNIGVFTTSYVVCRPTKKEARDYHDYYADALADWAAVDRLMALQVHSKSFPHDRLQEIRSRFAGGHGTYPIIGDPDLVAAELQRISDAGFAGTTIAFVNYLDELPYFVQEVLPRLEKMGLREMTGRANI